MKTKFLVILICLFIFSGVNAQETVISNYRLYTDSLTIINGDTVVFTDTLFGNVFSRNTELIVKSPKVKINQSFKASDFSSGRAFVSFLYYSKLSSNRNINAIDSLNNGGFEISLSNGMPPYEVSCFDNEYISSDSLYYNVFINEAFADSVAELYMDTVLSNCLSGNYSYLISDKYNKHKELVFIGRKMKETMVNVSTTPSNNYYNPTSGWAKSGVLSKEVCDLQNGEGQFGLGLIGSGEEVVLGFSDSLQLSSHIGSIVFGVYLHNNQLSVVADSIIQKTVNYSPNDNVIFAYKDGGVKLLLNSRVLASYHTIEPQLYFTCTAISSGTFLSSILVGTNSNLLYEVVHLSDIDSDDGQILLHEGVSASWSDTVSVGNRYDLVAGSYSGEFTSHSETMNDVIEVGYYTSWHCNNSVSNSTGGLFSSELQQRSRSLSVYDSGDLMNFWCEASVDMQSLSDPNIFYGIIGQGLESSKTNGFYLTVVNGLRAIVPIRFGRKSARENVVFVGDDINSLVLRLERVGSNLKYIVNGNLIYSENLLNGNNYRLVAFSNQTDNILEYSASQFHYLRAGEVQLEEEYISCADQTDTLKVSFGGLFEPASSDFYNCVLVNEETGQELLSNNYPFEFLEQPVSLYHAYVQTQYNEDWALGFQDFSDTVYSFVGNLPEGENLIETNPAYYDQATGEISNNGYDIGYFAFSNNLLPYEDGWIAVRYNDEFIESDWGFNTEQDGEVKYGYRMSGTSNKIVLLFNNEVLPDISVKCGSKDRLSVERTGNVISYFVNDSLIFGTDCQPNRELFLNGSITKNEQLKLGLSFCPRCEIAISPSQNIVVSPDNDAHLLITGVDSVSWYPEPILDNGINCLSCLDPVVSSEIGSGTYTIYGYQFGNNESCDEVTITIEVDSSLMSSQDDLEFGCNFINVGAFVYSNNKVCIFGNFFNETGYNDESLICQGRVLNVDTISVSGNWSNNCSSYVFVSNSGYVDLIGSEQYLKGLYPTKFSTLSLNDWSTLATEGKKILQSNQFVKKHLNLNKSELACNNSILSINSIEFSNSISFDEGGFVSTEGESAYLSWLVNNTDDYLYPLGERIGALLFRPLSIRSNVEQEVKIQFVPEDPEDNGLISLASDIYSINHLFYHKIIQENVNAKLGIDAHYNNYQDGDYQHLAYWSNSNIWNSLMPSAMYLPSSLFFNNKYVKAEEFCCSQSTDVVLANVGLVINAEDFDSSEDEDGDGIPDEFDSDDDGDGIPDDCDIDSYPEGLFTDDNTNGIVDECDSFAQDQEFPPGDDADNDNIPDECDSYDNIAEEWILNAVDDDEDGIVNSCDNDIDGDGIINSSDNDDDDDGIWDIYDSDPSNTAEDIIIPENDENCDADVNTNNIPDCCDSQIESGVDTDLDNILNSCDTDIDGDGILNLYDDDQDGDGIDDGTCDADIDGDGVLDEGIDPNDDLNTNLILDDCENDYTVDIDDTDSDSDEISDDCDSNLDGTPLVVSDVDIDANGILDSCEDWDGDGIVNAYDQDDDNDGIPDDCDSDNNNDGNVDFGQDDADEDGINDDSDADANGDGILDEGSSDDNNNGIADEVEQLYGEQGDNDNTGTSFVLTYDGVESGNMGTTYSADQGNVMFYPLQEGNYTLVLNTDETCSTKGRVTFSVDSTGVIENVNYIDFDYGINGLPLSEDLYDLPVELQGIILNAQPIETEFSLNYTLSFGEENPLIFRNGEVVIAEFEDYELIDNITLEFYEGLVSGNLPFHSEIIESGNIDAVININDISVDFLNAGVTSGICTVLIIVQQSSSTVELKNQFVVNIDVE
ncbi:MAG: hypothetical protein PF517_05975 [Salinivirgaceae bacterium]|jgi:hypothetical protein|nr:hypothetical protein [Salinivirgaceae bacterium]